MHGKSLAIRMDNDAELTSDAFTEWCERQHIAVHFIQPGKPDQNAFIERFNKSYREKVLDAYLFDSLTRYVGSPNRGSTNTTRTGLKRASGVCRR